MRILGVSGSLQHGSSNSAVLRAMAAAPGEGHRLDVWDELGTLPHFVPGEDGGGAVASLRSALAEHDALLVATPEYAGGMPGSLKNALDWLVGTGELYGMALAVVSVAPQVSRGGNARRWVEETAGMAGARVVTSFTVAITPPVTHEAAAQAASSVWRQLVAALDPEDSAG